MMMDDILITDIEIKHGKKNKQLTKTEKSENNETTEPNSELDIPEYLDDFLQYSKKTIFITGNNNNINQNSTKKKIIIKKKKMANNIKSINNEKNEIEKKNTNEIEIKPNKKKVLNQINKSYAKVKNNYSQNKIKTTKIKLKMEESKINSEQENIEKEKKIKTNKKIMNLNEKLQKFEYEQNLIAYNYYFSLFQKYFINRLRNEIKIVYIFIKIKIRMISAVNKIISTYKGYNYRHNFKMNYILSKLLNIRNQKAEKINNCMKNFLIRIRTKKLLLKAENNYIIYSSINIENDKKLYFSYKHKSGREQNFYFEYSPLLKCFIFFINKNDDKYLKVIEGNFYDSNSNKLIDKSFEVNSKGENIINLPNIFKKADEISDKNDRIINRYIKLHKPSQRIMIDDYELAKKKSKDDYNLVKNSNSKSQKLGKIGNISRSRSFLKIKGECKARSILKPSRSYFNLRNGDKKIQFGKAKIKKYKNVKD